MFYLKIFLLLVHMVTLQCDRWGKCQWIDIKKQIYPIYFLNQLLNLSVKRVNERRYEFGDENGAESWVCAKIPHDGAIKKDCVPKVIEIVFNWLIAISCSGAIKKSHQDLSFRYCSTHSEKYCIHMIKENLVTRKQRNDHLRVICVCLSNIVNSQMIISEGVAHLVYFMIYTMV